jgi:uncharacterized membrane protein YqjE
MSSPPPFGASLRALGATLLKLVWARAELIAVEFEEEKERAAQKFILLAVAALFLALGLLLTAMAVVVIFWDTYRTLAACGVAVLYLGIGAWALLRLRELGRNSPPPFSATIDEFARDLKMLRGRDE